MRLFRQLLFPEVKNKPSSSTLPQTFLFCFFPPNLLLATKAWSRTSWVCLGNLKHLVNVLEILWCWHIHQRSRRAKHYEKVCELGLILNKSGVISRIRVKLMSTVLSAIQPAFCTTDFHHWYWVTPLRTGETHHCWAYSRWSYSLQNIKGNAN